MKTLYLSIPDLQEVGNRGCSLGAWGPFAGDTSKPQSWLPSTWASKGRWRERALWWWQALVGPLGGSTRLTQQRFSPRLSLGWIWSSQGRSPSDGAPPAPELSLLPGTMVPISPARAEGALNPPGAAPSPWLGFTKHSQCFPLV